MNCHFLIEIIHSSLQKSSLLAPQQQHMAEQQQHGSIYNACLCHFEKWLEEWSSKLKEDEKNSELSAVEPTFLYLTTLEGTQPVTRVVLLKDIEKTGDFVVVGAGRKFTNISQCKKVSMLFYWPNCLEGSRSRQVRIKGICEIAPRNETLAYFKSRPYYSQWISSLSKQSEVRERSFEDVMEEVKQNITDSKSPECPTEWNLYYISPVSFEFWEEGGDWMFPNSDGPTRAYLPHYREKISILHG